jgi:uncharacterized NAD(P)/FAD-binding protein YdhS
MNKCHIAIVGAGASGVLLALALSDRMRGRCRLRLFDRDGQFGRGVAYAAPAEWHRLNVPAAKMGGRDDKDPNGFVAWLAQGHRPTADYSDAFVPRRQYGDYLCELLSDLVATGVAVTSRAEVIAVEPRDGAHTIVTDTGDAVAADVAVLCLGNPSPQSISRIPISERWIGNIWKAGALSKVAAQDRVLVVGSGATAVDATLDLVHRKVGHHILMVSRKGLLPRVDIPPVPYSAFEDLNLTTPEVRGLMRILRHEIRRAASSGVPWQAVFDAFRQHVGVIWERTTDEERQRFLRHLRSIWLVHRHRLAPDVSALLSRLQSNGTLSIVAGRIQRAEAIATGYRGTIVERTTRERAFAVEWIVNCTGPDERYDRLDDPLVRQLLATGHARPGPMGLGLDVDEAGQICDRSGRPRRGLYALGPPTRGRFWEVTAVPWIRTYAGKIAAHIEGLNHGDRRQHHPAQRPRPDA